VSTPFSVPARGWLFPAGLAIAFLGSMTGVGGGLFAVPLLHYVWRFELKSAIATALVLVGTNALFATVAELFHPNNALRLDLFVALALGTLVGNQLGYAAVRRIAVRRLKQVFVFVLAIAAARLVLSAPAAAAIAGTAAPELGPRALGIAVGLGVGGGFVAPLLGVGGGLVMVPGLLLGLPVLGFNAVRAASMATSVISAARSAWLHHGERRVRLAEGAWLGSGAVFGSIAGVWVAHGEGFEAIGRPLLAAILILVAVRFAREAWGAAPPTVATTAVSPDVEKP